jgi:hypothetical protein
MQTFIQIIEKIKKIKGLTFDYEVADLLVYQKKLLRQTKRGIVFHLKSYLHFVAQKIFLLMNC